MTAKTFIKIMSDEDRKRYVEISFEIIKILRDRERLEPPECAFILEKMLESLKRTEKIGEFKTW
jgi:hypothetical protein